MVAFQFPGKDNIPSPDFPNYSGHGSRYCVLALFFFLRVPFINPQICL